MPGQTVLIVDAHGVITRASTSATRTFGVVVGRTCCEVVDLRGPQGAPRCSASCVAGLIRHDITLETEAAVRGRPARAACSPVGDGLVVSLAVGEEPAGDGALTEREAQVVRLSADGMTMKEAAVVLGLSPTTVRTHVDNAKAKLGARSLAGLIARAAELGLLGARR